MNNKKTIYLDGVEYINVINKMNKELEKVRRDFISKDRNSQNIANEKRNLK